MDSKVLSATANSVICTPAVSPHTWERIMTNEEMQRTMEFILEQQAQVAASIQRSDEERIRDKPRLVRLEESFQRLVVLSEIADSRLDRLESKSSALESNIERLESSTSAVAANVGRLESNTSALAANIGRLESNTSALAANIERLEFNTSALERNMSTLQANMDALAISQAQTQESLRAYLEKVASIVLCKRSSVV
jgi:chromosome segregation ATPase